MLNKLFKWIFAPLNDIKITNKKEEILIEVPEEKKIKKKKKKFKPTNFKEYIGQKRIKEILKIYIKATKERKITFPHLLLYGKPGCGKTTLAKVIANEIGVKFKEYITSNIIGFYDIFDTVEDLKGGFLFLDEIHAIHRDITEQFYAVMEDFTFEGDNISEFTLVGATTELGEIEKNRKPFLDRFKIILEFDDYTINDMIKIGKQYRHHMFPNDFIGNMDMRLLAKNCRLTPRKLIRLVEGTIFFKDPNKVLESFKIIKNGYTKKDLKVLEYLYKNKSNVGLKSIVAYLGTSQANYIYGVEEYLLRSGVIIITGKGRKLTEKGEKIIKELRKVFNKKK